MTDAPVEGGAAMAVVPAVPAELPVAVVPVVPAGLAAPAASALPRRPRGRLPTVVAALALAVLPAAVAGCARAADATPESTVFGYSGSTLNVVSRYHVPTDLVATDRQDIKVTRWFKADGIAEERTGWELEGDTLTLEASCSGFADCDARFRVEVPPHIAVLRDGRATELKGAGPA
ncbi:hypothetical protein [Kitasatospora sp. NPDC015120]|uniref:hypothetical protein n=1 Tax=Kitasatospora sp. NPDC015120 TaxID=3364023 RepID=UPI0036F496F3